MDQLSLGEGAAALLAGEVWRPRFLMQGVHDGQVVLVEADFASSAAGPGGRGGLTCVGVQVSALQKGEALLQAKAPLPHGLRYTPLD